MNQEKRKAGRPRKQKTEPEVRTMHEENNLKHILITLDELNQMMSYHLKMVREQTGTVSDVDIKYCQDLVVRILIKKFGL